MRQICNKIIKLLGGYTEKEYKRVERKYQGLLDSRTNKDCTYICNEYIMRVLRDLDEYAKNDLYGKNGDSWSKKMFNVIHNNYLRVIIKYLNCKSNAIYRIDTTLDGYKEFNKIVEDEKNDEDIFILKNNDWEI